MPMPYPLRGIGPRHFVFTLIAGLSALSVSIATLGCDGNSIFRLPEPSVQYVAFGDSATKGDADRSYPDFLKDALGSGAVSNEGDSGETSREGLSRLRSLIGRGIFPNARALLYWEGGNDLIDLIKDVDPLVTLSPDSPNYPLADLVARKLDEIQANIEAVIDLGKQVGWNVYVATYYFFPEGSLNCDPMPLNVLLPEQARNANVYVTMLNDRIRSAAANQGAILVDVATADDALRGQLSNYISCNHLSTSGNEIVAGLFLDAIQGDALADRRIARK